MKRCARAVTVCRASITELPVTKIRDSSIPSPSKRPPRAIRRREAEVGEDVEHPAAGLLGEGAVEVSGAQPGLHVGDRDALVEGRQTAGKRRDRVALDGDQIRALGGEDRLEPGERLDRDVGQRLRRPHDVEIVVGRDVESGQHLVEHGAMLRGHHHPGFDVRPMLRQPGDERRHLDRLGARPEDDRDPLAAAAAQGLSRGISTKGGGGTKPNRANRPSGANG